MPTQRASVLAIYTQLHTMATGIKKDSPPDLSDEAGTVDSGPPVNEKALLRKLDLRLLPAVGVLYLLSFLDRSNGMFCLYFETIPC